MACTFLPLELVPKLLAGAAVLLACALVATLVMMVRLATEIIQLRGTPRSPRVIGARRATGAMPEGVVTCLLEPSELFSFGSLVSVLYVNEGFEQLIAIGEVTLVQEDRRIQVALIRALPGHDEAVRRVERNDAAILSQVLVKPSVPGSVVQLRQGGRA